MDFVVFFLVGAMVGSFLNVVLLRKNTGESVVFERSRCFSCGHTLGFWDLIPIFSFLFLRGRCRHCGSKISWQYPIVELLTGLLASTVFLKIFNPQLPIFNQFLSFTQFPHHQQFQVLWFIYYFTAFCILLLIAIYDFKRKIIDSHFLWLFGVFSVIEFIRRGNFADDLSVSFLIAMFFYLMWLASSGRWMGRGDSNLAFLCALFLGSPPNLAMLILSFWIGGIFGILLLIFQRSRISLKSEIPFAPFLALAMFSAWYFSEFIDAFRVIIGL